MKTDPTDTGGLFVSRRPGTRPIRYRAEPRFSGALRQRVDRGMAVAILAVMVVVNLLYWGPFPLAWLWVGSQVDGATESTFLGIIVAFVGLLFTLILGLVVLRRLDLAWILVRRAGGHDQRAGMVVRVFAVTAVVGATLFFGWLFFIGGLTPQLAPGT
jgi:uncharacterized membrane protein (DUF485 family)